MNAALQTNVQHNLASFSIMGDDENAGSLYNFGGQDFSQKKSVGLLIDLGQRERKGNSNYDAKNALDPSTAYKVGRKRTIVMMDHQFYNKDAMEWFFEREDELEVKRQVEMAKIAEVQSRAKIAPSLKNIRANVDLEPGQSSEELFAKAAEMEINMNTSVEFRLSDEEKAERKALVDEAFSDWSKSDFKIFTRALETHGRYNLEPIQAEISNETGKPVKEIQRYYCAFLRRYREIDNFQKLIDR